jgi:glycosyltransferase involved in cell wall biosynthesis
VIRVLYLTDNPTLGGTINILKGWLPLGRAAGLVGHVVTPPGSKFLQWLAPHDVPHTTSPMPWPSRRWPVPSLWHAWRLARWARRHGIDLIHCNEHNVYPFAALLRRFLRLPLVCHVRYRVEPAFGRWAFAGQRAPDALLWTSGQQRADSAAATDGIVPADRQHIVPLGLDLATFGSRDHGRNATRTAWGLRPEEIVMGQACALRPRKRVEEFIDLVAQLAREDERVVGVLAGDAMPGDEPYRDKVLNHIAANKLGRRFVWLGNLDDVEPFYHGIDVFVSTSEYETFGNSVCEAMACARPVVAYRGGSVHEVVGEAGLVVDDCDLPALTAAARRCLQKVEVRESLGRAGRERVRGRFSPAASLQQVMAIYESLVVTGRPVRAANSEPADPAQRGRI